MNEIQSIIMSSDESASRDRFIAAFRSTLVVLECDVISSNEAVECIRQVFPLFYERAKAAEFLAPDFPDHGVRHPGNLAEIVHNLFKTWGASETIRSSADYALLLFSSLLFHDIGMASPFIEGLTLDRIVAEQATRRDHDLRSRRFIEAKFISQAHQGWNDYWSTRTVKNVGIHSGSTAAYILARICQSHGDEIGAWLSEESFKYYFFDELGQGKGSRVDLVHKSGSDWPNILELMRAASGVLCLADLCDVGPHRWQRLDSEGRTRFLPEIRRRPTSKLHYVAHQMCQPIIDLDGHITFKVARRDRSEKGKLGPDECACYITLVSMIGPVADATFYCGRTELRDALKLSFSKQFAGARIVSGSVDNERWEKRSKELFEEDRTDWIELPHPFEVEVGAGNCSDPIETKVTIPLWWNFASISTTIEKFTEEDSTLKWIKYVDSLRRRGLPLEEFCEPLYRPVEGRHPIFVTKQERRGEHEGAAISEAFIGAMRVVRELIFHSPGRVHLVAKGNEDFSSGLSRTQIGQHDVVICIVKVDGTADIGDYTKFFSRFSRNHPRKQLILCGLEKYKSSFPEVFHIATRFKRNSTSKLRKYLENNLTTSNERSLSKNSHHISELVRDFELSKRPARINLNVMAGALVAKDPNTRCSTASELLYYTIASAANISRSELDVKTVEDCYNVIGEEILKRSKFGELTHVEKVRDELSSKGIIQLHQQTPNVMSVDCTGFDDFVAENFNRYLYFTLFIEFVLIRLSRMGVPTRHIKSLSPPLNSKSVSAVLSDVLDEKAPLQVRMKTGINWAGFDVMLSSKANFDSFIEFLDCIKLHDRLDFSERGLILWILCYRVVRSFILNVAENWDKITWSVPALLAVVESIGSYKADDRLSNPLIKQALERAFKELRLRLEDLEQRSLICAMIVDIVDRYWDDNDVLKAVVDQNSFAQILLATDGYLKTARYFHGRTEDCPGEIEHGLLIEWAKVRKKMIRINDEYTPDSLRRNTADTVLVDRIEAVLGGLHAP